MEEVLLQDLKDVVGCISHQLSQFADVLQNLISLQDHFSKVILSEMVLESESCLGIDH